jgi:hypothetical protein
VLCRSDYPTGSKAAQQPIFSMCGGGGGEDFLLPTYDMMMSVRTHFLRRPAGFMR